MVELEELVGSVCDSEHLQSIWLALSMLRWRKLFDLQLTLLIVWEICSSLPCHPSMQWSNWPLNLDSKNKWVEVLQREKPVKSWWQVHLLSASTSHHQCLTASSDNAIVVGGLYDPKLQADYASNIFAHDQGRLKAHHFTTNTTMSWSPGHCLSRWGRVCLLCLRLCFIASFMANTRCVLPACDVQF